MTVPPSIAVRGATGAARGEELRERASKKGLVPKKLGASMPSKRNRRRLVVLGAASRRSSSSISARAQRRPPYKRLHAGTWSPGCGVPTNGCLTARSRLSSQNRCFCFQTRSRSYPIQYSSACCCCTLCGNIPAHRQ
jgi:hypothetical protein